MLLFFMSELIDWTNNIFGVKGLTSNAGLPTVCDEGDCTFFLQISCNYYIMFFFYVNDGSFFKDLFICFSLLEN